MFYFAGWAASSPVNSTVVSINESDVDAIVEVCQGLDGQALDLIICSPGGLLSPTEQIAVFLRNSFKSIRAIVPRKAMSAATMLACATDEILMARHSFLGPVDPQLFIDGQMLPSKLILDRMRLLLESAPDQEKWNVCKEQTIPLLLVRNAERLGEKILAGWLADYMLADHAQPDEQSATIARFLSDHYTHLSHGRPLHAKALLPLGLKIKSLEADKKLYGLVMQACKSAREETFSSNTVKIIAAHNGQEKLATNDSPVFAW